MKAAALAGKLVELAVLASSVEHWDVVGQDVVVLAAATK